MCVCVSTAHAILFARRGEGRGTGSGCDFVGAARRRFLLDLSCGPISIPQSSQTVPHKSDSQQRSLSPIRRMFPRSVLVIAPCCCTFCVRERIVSCFLLLCAEIQQPDRRRRSKTELNPEPERSSTADAADPPSLRQKESIVKDIITRIKKKI